MSTVFWCTALFLVLVLMVQLNGAGTEKDLQKALFKNYKGRHRPVKKDSTTMQVSVFIAISHIEKVDEWEQTMTVHGHLWATWIDEYMTWSSNDYPNITRIQVETWRLWQPALALYNSARGNAWHLYMHDLPATIYYTGKVWASGAFTFYVTCQFDFSDWPYDTQTCPIVISDWVYDLSRVNLSDPYLNDNVKPLIRLNFDPESEGASKRHVAGWYVEDTWRRHCYWGPSGCIEEIPEGQPEWYWSLLEFGVKISRHVPYYGLLLFTPLAITAVLTLMSFWVDSLETGCLVLLINVAVQAFCGWEIIQQLPPGSGSSPKLVKVFALNLFMTAFAYAVNVIVQFLETNLAEDFDFGLNLPDLPRKLGLTSFFAVKGLSFDPQEFLKDEREQQAEQGLSNPITSIGLSDAFDGSAQPTTSIADPKKGDDDETTLIPLSTLIETSDEDYEVNARSSDVEAGKTGTTKNFTQLQLQFFTFRRILFVVYVLVDVLAVIYFVF